MRSLLMTLLLLVTAVLLYQAIVTGEGGMRMNVEVSGAGISEHIRSMGP